MSPSSPWSWDPKVRRFRDPRGRFISHATMVGIRDQIIESNRQWLADLVADLVGGDVTIQQWERLFMDRLRQIYIIQYQLGRGGSNAMTQLDWDAIEAALQRQYGYLRSFAQEIAAGRLSPEQIAARAQLYLSSATSPYEQGMAAARGLELPAYPGDGSTRCKCITTPQSRVLTASGWKPIADVVIGDYVLTHRLRWRMVTDVIVKLSEPYHRQVYVKADDGNWVGATDNHRWYTDNGWQDANDIDSSDCVMYHLRVSQLSEEISHAKILQSVWWSPIESKQARVVQGMSIGVQLWESQGLSGRPVSVLQCQTAGKSAMAGQDHPTEDDGRVERGWNQASSDMFGPILEYELAEEDRWPAMDVDLGWESQAHDLPIPVGVDRIEWTNPGWIPYPPQESRQDGRFLRESRANGNPRSQQAPREYGTREISEQYAKSCVRTVWDVIQETDTPEETGEILLTQMPDRIHESDDTRVDLCSLWTDVQAPTRSRDNAQILFGGMLPPGTPLYDLTVDEDHSFVIEGLFAHNSNCRCSWRIVERKDRFDCYWTLASAEHCPDCIERGKDWHPYTILK